MTWWLWLILGILTGGVSLIVALVLWLHRFINDLDRGLGMPHTRRDDL